AEVERVAAEDVADAVATDDHDLEAGLFSNRLESCRHHLARRPDAEALAGNDECLAAMDAFPKVGHQVTEGAHLPALIESVEALRNAVVRGGAVRRGAGVELLPRNLWVPEDERAPSDQVTALLRPVDRRGHRAYGCGGARLTTRGRGRVRRGRDEPLLSSRSRTASAPAVVVSAPPSSFVVRRSPAAD